MLKLKRPAAAGAVAVAYTRPPRQNPPGGFPQFPAQYAERKPGCKLNDGVEIKKGPVDQRGEREGVMKNRPENPVLRI